MNRIRLLAIGATLMFALTTVAQQTTTNHAKDASNDEGVPTVERHLKLLSDKLDLTSDQQAKAKPILQEMQDSMLKFTQDESMSPDERTDNVKASRYKADKQLRKILSDDQKKKLDQIEEEPHSVLHGNMNGATPPAQAPQN